MPYNIPTDLEVGDPQHVEHHIEMAEAINDLDTRVVDFTVNGSPVTSFNFDTTPITPGDINAYTKSETDDLVAGVQTYGGISMFDVGNAETLPRAPGFKDVTIGSGTLWLAFFTAPRTTSPLTRLGYPGRTPAPSGITLARMAIFTVASNGNITKVAQTASFTPSASAYTDNVNNLSTASGFPATYTLQKGVRYAFGVLLVGTTPGTIHGWDIPGAGNQPIISRRVTGQTDIAASYTNAQQTDHYEGLYLFARHATG